MMQCVKRKEKENNRKGKERIEKESIKKTIDYSLSHKLC